METESGGRGFLFCDSDNMPWQSSEGRVSHCTGAGGERLSPPAPYPNFA